MTNEEDLGMVRFDLNIPVETAATITEIAKNTGLRPRTLGRVLLMERVRQIEKQTEETEKCNQ